MADPTIELCCLCGQCPRELTGGVRDGWVETDQILAWLRGRCRPIAVDATRKHARLVIGGGARG